jgi:outer membrane murein-binding lipoprotein Lpp
LVRIAFADEIASAVDNVAAQIDELEKIINEGN